MSVVACISPSKLETATNEREGGELASAISLDMCHGLTIRGSRCKHRSQNDSLYCKKHQSNGGHEDDYDDDDDDEEEEDENALVLADANSPVELDDDEEENERLYEVNARRLSFCNSDDDLGNENAIYRCKICKKVFLDNDALAGHCVVHHEMGDNKSNISHACAICLDSFDNKDMLVPHVQKMHNSPFSDHLMLLKCNLCGCYLGCSK